MQMNHEKTQERGCKETGRRSWISRMQPWNRESLNRRWLVSTFLLVLAFAISAPIAADHVCDHDGDGHDSFDCGGDDCDDFDVNRFPGNIEVCDNQSHDEDCDPSTFGVRDVDADGGIDDACCNDVSGFPLTCGTDCDDFDPHVHPGMPEMCDGVDNDCNGAVDDNNAVKVTAYADDDEDGWAEDGASPQLLCPSEALAAQWTVRSGGGDCNDSDHHVNPRSREICNGIDDNCNGIVDEGFTGLCH